MTSIEIAAPAKVNLFLQIVNKREDSYHDLFTLFEKISLADRITISKIPCGIVLTSDIPITTDPKDNLAYKAAELVLRRARIKSGVAIHIKKKIPLASGLGGGSSDAASVLMGIDRLFRLRLKQAELLKMGLCLGADVPFFLSEAPFAIGRSVGDLLEKVDIRIKLWHLIVYSGSKTSTKDIYRAFDLLKAEKGKKSRLYVKAPAFAKCLTTHGADDKIQHPIDFEALETMLYNDLQGVAVAKNKVIGDTIKRLANSLRKKVVMSGSGPSVFCLCRTRKEALEYKKKLYSSMPADIMSSWQVFIAGTEN